MLMAGPLLIKNELAKAEYDWLIQLCDSLAGAEGVPDIEERMGNVKKRYGSYPQDKWNSNIRLMHYFEEKMGKNIDTVCEQDTFCTWRFIISVSVSFR